MNGAVKTTLVTLVAGVVLGPLALVGLIAMAMQAQGQSCTPEAAVPPASAGPAQSPSPTASAGGPGSGSGTASTSPGAPTAPASTAPPVAATCDGGDGLPGDGGGGIPPGFQPPSNAQQAIAVAFALAQLGKPYVFGAAGP